MKKSLATPFYLFIWIVTIFLLGFLIVQLYGDARIINYTGLVRGYTQKLVKSELNGTPNDDMVTYVDDVIYDLETGMGAFHLRKEHNEGFQAQLAVVSETWGDLKTCITQYRTDNTQQDALYALSELHYTQADELVRIEERLSELKIWRFIGFYCFTAILCFAGAAFFQISTKKALEASRTTDPLTGAWTPRAFVREAHKLLDAPNAKTYAVIAFDIRQFKLINIKYGHHHADALLCAIVKGLNVPPSQLVSRFVSDDFFVLTPWQNDLEDTFCATMETILAQASFTLTNAKETLTFRCGAYVVNNGDAPVQTAMDHAHAAHKLARETGATFVWCDGDLLAQLHKETYIQERFPLALAQAEFQLFLQPQVDLQTGKIVSAESLVRWKPADGTLLFPDEFIPFLERKGLIKHLDYTMLEQVCAYQEARKIKGETLYPISVNFSRVTLLESDFAQKILDTVAQYELPTHCIGIEIVETALNSLNSDALTFLVMLKDAGFKMAMDDFGAGYSSLSVLGDLPVHVLKLDKQFLWRIEKNPKIGNIIISCIDMAHKIGLKVICEGVETQSHADFLRTVGCDYAQGYLYSKPVSKEDYLWEAY